MVGAMAHNDQVVTAAGGIALRYGGFYGDEHNTDRRSASASSR